MTLPCSSPYYCSWLQPGPAQPHGPLRHRSTQQRQPLRHTPIQSSPKHRQIRPSSKHWTATITLSLPRTSGKMAHTTSSLSTVQPTLFIGRSYAMPSQPDLIGLPPTPVYGHPIFNTTTTNITCTIPPPGPTRCPNTAPTEAVPLGLPPPTAPLAPGQMQVTRLAAAFNMAP